MGADSWAALIVNCAIMFLFLVGLLLLWQRLTFDMWTAWSAGRNEEVLRRPAIPSDLKLRLFDRGGRLLIHCGFAGILSLPFVISVTWSAKLLNEARVYWTIATIAGVLFVSFMAIGLIADLITDFAQLLQPVREQFKRNFLKRH